jgi:hypothetical protein
MMRHLHALVVAFVIVSSLASGCIPRHPPHTPQPVPEVSTKQLSPG